MNFNNIKFYIIAYIVLAVVVFFTANYFFGFFVDLGNKINSKNVSDSFLKGDFKLLVGISLIGSLIVFLKAFKK